MLIYILQAVPPASPALGFNPLLLLAISIVVIALVIRYRRKQIDEKNLDNQVQTTQMLIKQDQTRYYKCFIAGSTALQMERDAIRAVIGEIHNRWSSKNIYITSYTFEDFSNNVHVGGLQSQYDRFITLEADSVIFIIDGEIGDKTLHEFNISLKSYAARNRPSIYVYNCIEGKSHPQSDAFINRVKMEGHYWRQYSNVTDLKLKFKEDITNELIEKYVL